MKTYLIKSFLLVALICFGSCKNQTENETNDNTISGRNDSESQSFDRNKETAAIKEVIIKETESFFSRDYDQWKTYWIKKDYSFRAGNGPDSTYAMYGWKNIVDHIENYDKEVHKDKEGVKFTSPKRENLTIKFNSNRSAYAKWEQYNRVASQDIYYKSEESRLLEKEGDNWKIVNVLSFWDTSKPVDSLTVQNSFKG